jgi:hypothetical protein
MTECCNYCKGEYRIRELCVQVEYARFVSLRTSYFGGSNCNFVWYLRDGNKLNSMENGAG